MAHESSTKSLNVTPPTQEPGAQAPDDSSTAQGRGLRTGGPFAWLLLAPALLMAWPSPNPLAGDFATTEITATGIAALSLLPLCVWLLWKRPRPARGSLLLFLPLLLPASLGLMRADPAGGSDGLESDRATLTFLIGILAASGASILDDVGKRNLLRGLCVSSILFILPALFDASSGWGGVLGNSGEISGAALPGALCGMLLWSNDTGHWTWVGMSAVGLCLLHALMAPVLATLLILAVVSGLVAFSGSTEGPVGRSKIASVLLIVLIGAGWIGGKRLFSESAAPTTTGGEVAQAPPTIGGGFEVRQRVWLASLPMIADRLFTGYGSGQFAVQFPPYRDPVELELSTWNHQIEQNTEVENPHNDWLLPWIEGGVLVGVSWWIYLGSVLFACWRALRRGGPWQRAIAAGALGTVIGAFFNAPLLYNPSASVMSFLLFGALLGPGAERRPLGRAGWSFATLLTPGLVLLMLLSTPRAFDMWQHGNAIAELGKTSSVTDHGLSVEKALEACPDSVVARTFEARLRAMRNQDLAGSIESWKQVLALRPHRFEAWMQRGVLHARLGELDDARVSFARAFELDPAHPGLARNRVRCFAESGDSEAALAELDRLEAMGLRDPLWLLDLCSELLLGGSIGGANSLLPRVDERFAEMNGELAWGLDAEYRRSGNSKVADAFRSLAYVLWARDQAANAQWEDAKRSYFQALRVMRDYVPPAGPDLLRLEHAASLWHAGQEAEARESLAGIESAQLNWARMLPWVREALFALGVAQSESEVPGAADSSGEEAAEQEDD